MKKVILTLIAITVVVLSTAKLTYAATTDSTRTAADSIYTPADSIAQLTTVLENINGIKKIEASGNVEVYVTSGDQDAVKVLENYYTQTGLVQEENGVLRITSYNTDKLMVMVTVKDLSEVKATNGALIKSNGTLSAIQLNVNLDNNATAELKLDVFAASVTATGHAKAELSGSVADYDLNYSHSSTVNSTELATISGTEKVIAHKTAATTEDGSDADIVASL